MRGLLAIILLSVFSVQAQLQPVFKDTILRTGSEIELNGNLDFLTTSVRNDLSSKFIFGGFITDQIKDLTLSKHKTINTAGVDAAGRVAYINYDWKLMKNKDFGVIIHADNEYFLGTQYSKPLYELAFYGNSKYVGGSMDLSNLNLSYTNMQKLGFGLIDPKTKSFATLNLYNIQSRMNANFSDLQVNQNEDGSEVELIMNGDVAYSSSKNWNQGLGIGLDFEYNFAFHYSKKDASKVALIQLKATNLGYGFTTEDQSTYTVDTSFVFSGFRFDQILGDNALNLDSLDILDTLGIRNEMKTRSFFLPGYFQVAKMINSSSDQKVQSFYGVRMYPTLTIFPLAYVGVDYHFHEKIRAGASVSYGGFGGIRGGLYLNAKFNKFSAGIGTSNIVGLISKSGYGKSLNLQVKCEL